MLQIFKYNLKQLLHNRSELFWVILFPIILGSLFKAAFSNITAGEKFQAIPVAIVNEQGSMSDGFMETVKELDKNDKDRFLKAVYCDKKQALSLLKKEKVDGIIQVDDNISLTVSSDMSSAKLNQSILSAFIEEYQMNYQAIVKIVKTHPEKLSEAMDILQESASYNQEVSYGKNVDTYDQYFYNLIAMACLYTAMGGINLAINNSANLSSLAARKTIAPAKRAALIGTELLAIILFESLLNMVSFLFIVTVLGIHMTTHLGLALLTILISTTFSITFGMFLGCVGPKSEGGKTGLMFAVVMPLCFLSGLMMGTMRMVVEKYAPFVNRINPAALISDSFYALNNYDTLTRYTGNILTLLLMTALFLIISILVTRRNTYASL